MEKDILHSLGRGYAMRSIEAFNYFDTNAVRSFTVTII